MLYNNTAVTGCCKEKKSEIVTRSRPLELTSSAGGAGHYDVRTLVLTWQPSDCGLTLGCSSQYSLLVTMREDMPLPAVNTAKSSLKQKFSTAKSNLFLYYKTFLKITKSQKARSNHLWYNVPTYYHYFVFRYSNTNIIWYFRTTISVNWIKGAFWSRNSKKSFFSYS